MNIDAEMTLSKDKRRRSPFCFKTSSYGEITVNGQKVIGSAQRRYKDGFLQQGSLLMNFDAGELGRVLRAKHPEKDYFEIGKIKKYASEVSVESLRKAIRQAFEKTFGINFFSGSPSRFELNLAEKLQSEKYSNDKWNFCR